MKPTYYLLAFLLLCTTGARASDHLDAEQVLDSFHQAAARADADTYLGHLTEEAIFLGTDGTERWQGQAFRDFVSDNFSAGRGWTYVAVDRNIDINADGQTAWFDELLDNEALGQCRGSGVMLRTADGWKIAQYNLSVPIPNGLVMQVVADIGAVTEEGDSAASSAVAAEGSKVEVVEETATESPQRSDCARKRHKTNRKAGC